MFSAFCFQTSTFFPPFAEDSCPFPDFVLLRHFLLVDVRTISANHRTCFRLYFSGCNYSSRPRKLRLPHPKILSQICKHVRGERANVSGRSGRALRFSLGRCSPSPFFAVPFSAEHPRSFRNASSNACARKTVKIVLSLFFFFFCETVRVF